MHKITVKIGDSLRTIQADTHEEFQVELSKAHDSLQECYDLMVAARAVGNVAQTPAPVQAQATAQPAPAAPATPAAFTNAVAPLSSDGQPMVPKAGSSAKGPWKGWFDARGKGHDAPKFVSRGTPEWDNFPA
jgi:hypothetical protein